MPKHYFHIAKGEQAFRDDEGREFDDLASAHRYALQLIYKTMLYDPDESDWRGWRVDVADGTGRRLMSVLYPSGNVLPRKTFGRRVSSKLSLSLSFALALCFSAGVAESQPIPESFLCMETGSSLSCSFLVAPSDGMPRLVHVAPAGDPEQGARAAERQHTWMIRCRPTLERDAYGVGRYRYAAPGCEFGKVPD